MTAQAQAISLHDEHAIAKQLFVIQSQMAGLKKEEDKLKGELKHLLGEGDLADAGNGVAYRVDRSEKRKFDKRASRYIAMRYPKLAPEFMSVSETGLAKLFKNEEITGQDIDELRGFSVVEDIETLRKVEL